MKRIDYLFDSFSIFCGIMQTEHLFQIILLVLGIISSIISIIYSLYSWYINAKKDGIITKEEVQTGINIAINEVKEIQDKIKKKGENKNE